MKEYKFKILPRWTMLALGMVIGLIGMDLCDNLLYDSFSFISLLGIPILIIGFILMYSLFENVIFYGELDEKEREEEFKNKTTTITKQYKFKILPRRAILIIGVPVFFTGIILCNDFFYSNMSFTNFLGLPLLMIGLTLMFAPFSKIVFYGELTNKEIELEFERKKSDLGYFKYYTNGFEFKLKKILFNTKWLEIKKIICYKKDLFYYDQVIIELTTIKNKKLIITEDTKGYYQFIKFINKNLEGVLEDWDLKVLFPVFEESYTLVYFKGRDLNLTGNASNADTEKRV